MVEMLRRVFFTDLNNKAMALVLAILIWAYAFNNTGGKDAFRVKLNIVPEFPEQQIIVSRIIKGAIDPRYEDKEFDGHINLTIKGQKNKLEEYQGKGEVEFVHKVTVAGTVNLLNSALYDLEPGFEVVDADISKVEVVIEDLMTAPIKIDPQVIGDPDPPYKRPPDEAVQFQPEVIELVGPASAFETFDSVPFTVDLEGRAGPTVDYSDYRPSIAHLPKGVRYGDGAPDKIRIIANLAEEKHREEFQGIQVRFPMPPDVAVRVTNVSLESITLQGPRDVIERLLKQHKEEPLVVYVKPELTVDGSTPIQIRRNDLKFLEGVLPPGVSVHVMKPKTPNYFWNFVEEKTSE